MEQHRPAYLFVSGTDVGGTGSLMGWNLQVQKVKGTWVQMALKSGTSSSFLEDIGVENSLQGLIWGNCWRKDDLPHNLEGHPGLGLTWVLQVSCRSFDHEGWHYTSLGSSAFIRDSPFTVFILVPFPLWYSCPESLILMTKQWKGENKKTQREWWRHLMVLPSAIPSLWSLVHCCCNESRWMPVMFSQPALPQQAAGDWSSLPLLPQISTSLSALSTHSL